MGDDDPTPTYGRIAFALAAAFCALYFANVFYMWMIQPSSGLIDAVVEPLGDVREVQVILLMSLFFVIFVVSRSRQEGKV